jgi:hypothetical protein
MVVVATTGVWCSAPSTSPDIIQIFVWEQKWWGSEVSCHPAGQKRQNRGCSNLCLLIVLHWLIPSKEWYQSCVSSAYQLHQGFQGFLLHLASNNSIWVWVAAKCLETVSTKSVRDSQLHMNSKKMLVADVISSGQVSPQKKWLPHWSPFSGWTGIRSMRRIAERVQVWTDRICSSDTWLCNPVSLLGRHKQQKPEHCLQSLLCSMLRLLLLSS